VLCRRVEDYNKQAIILPIVSKVIQPFCITVLQEWHKYVLSKDKLARAN
jgi:hypothetical protein